MNRTLWMLACLVLLTVAVYWPVGHYGLINLDDRTYLFDNPYIKLGLTAPGLRDAFTHFRFVNYAPLVSISYYTDQDLFKLNPGPMHVENVLLHLITGLLLWRLLLMCTGKFYRSFAVAALFLCHPMHVESVAWISERKDVLSTPLLIGAMMGYVGYCKKENRAKKWRAYGLMIFLFVLSLLTKSMGVTLPAVLLLMDLWPLRRWPGRTWVQLFVEKIPLILFSGISSVVSATAKGDSVSSFVQLDLMTRIENALICYVAYHQLGGMAFQAHDLKTAAEDFELALASSPDPDAYDGLGNCWLGVDRSKSIWYYTQAISLNPRSADYHLDLAVALRLNNNLAQAREQAQMALTLNPNLEFARDELQKINAQTGLGFETEPK